MEDQEKAQLVNLLNKIVSESVINHSLETRFMLSEVDGRTMILKKLAEQHGIDTEIVDNFDLAGIEAESFSEFLASALLKTETDLPFPSPVEGLRPRSKEF